MSASSESDDAHAGSGLDTGPLVTTDWLPVDVSGGSCGVEGSTGGGAVEGSSGGAVAVSVGRGVVEGSSGAVEVSVGRGAVEVSLGGGAVDVSVPPVEPSVLVVEPSVVVEPEPSVVAVEPSVAVVEPSVAVVEASVVTVELSVGVEDRSPEAAAGSLNVSVDDPLAGSVNTTSTPAVAVESTTDAIVDNSSALACATQPKSQNSPTKRHTVSHRAPREKRAGESIPKLTPTL